MTTEITILYEVTIWQDNIVEWNGMDIVKAMRATMSREGWRNRLIWDRLIFKNIK